MAWTRMTAMHAKRCHAFNRMFASHTCRPGIFSQGAGGGQSGAFGQESEVHFDV